MVACTWEEPGPSLLGHQQKGPVQSQGCDSYRKHRGPHLNRLGTVPLHHIAVLGTGSVGRGHRASGTACRAHHNQARHCRLCSLPPRHSASPEGCILHCCTGTQRGCRGTLQRMCCLDSKNGLMTLQAQLTSHLPDSSLNVPGPNLVPPSLAFSCCFAFHKLFPGPSHPLASPSLVQRRPGCPIFFKH